jgi:hypothetical protein
MRAASIIVKSLFHDYFSNWKDTGPAFAKTYEAKCLSRQPSPESAEGIVELNSDRSVL